MTAASIYAKFSNGQASDEKSRRLSICPDESAATETSEGDERRSGVAVEDLGHLLMLNGCESNVQEEGEGKEKSVSCTVAEGDAEVFNDCSENRIENQVTDNIEISAETLSAADFIDIKRDKQTGTCFVDQGGQVRAH